MNKQVLNVVYFQAYYIHKMKIRGVQTNSASQVLSLYATEVWDNRIIKSRFLTANVLEFFLSLLFQQCYSTDAAHKSMGTEGGDRIHDSALTHIHTHSRHSCMKHTHTRKFTLEATLKHRTVIMQYTTAVCVFKKCYLNSSHSI